MYNVHANFPRSLPHLVRLFSSKKFIASAMPTVGQNLHACLLLTEGSVYKCRVNTGLNLNASYFEVRVSDCSPVMPRVLSIVNVTTATALHCCHRLEVLCHKTVISW